MRDAYKSIAAPGDNAHAKLIEWGAMILQRFNVDNLHTKDGLSHDSQAQVAAPAVLPPCPRLPPCSRRVRTRRPLHSCCQA